MNVESRVRERIESLLINHERGQAELRAFTLTEALPEYDDPEEERDLYHRVINSYRSAVAEVNGLLEEHIGYLSAFYHVLQAIREKRDFQEICTAIVQCAVDHLAVEYCSLLFLPKPRGADDYLCFEVLTDGHKFLRIHSTNDLAGCREVESAVLKLACERRDALVIDDLYGEARFRAIDFPMVMRSLACVPVERAGSTVGFLLLSHSRPRFFGDGHLRLFRIVGSLISHLMLLTLENPGPSVSFSPADLSPQENDAADLASVVLLEFEMCDPSGRRVLMAREAVRSARAALRRTLRPKESILFHEESSLVVLLPGVASVDLPSRLSVFRGAFENWRKYQPDRFQAARMSVGCATCGAGSSLLTCLEMASHLMHPGRD